MSRPARTKPSEWLRLLSVASVLALAMIVVSVYGNTRLAPAPPVLSDVHLTSGVSAPSLPSPDASARAATPRELVALEAAGLVTLARPMPDPQMGLAWQGDAGYHVWGDCTDPIARQAAPELCG